MSHLATYVPAEIYPLTTDGSNKDLAALATDPEAKAVRQIQNKSGGAASLHVVMVGGDPAGVVLAWADGEIKRGQFKSIIGATSDNAIDLEIGV